MIDTVASIPMRMVGPIQKGLGHLEIDLNSIGSKQKIVTVMELATTTVSIVAMQLLAQVGYLNPV